MSNKNVRAVVVRPLSAPVAENIDAGLDGLQALVEGYIEVISLAPGIDAYVNEEAIILGLPINRVLITSRDLGWPNEELLPICGTIVILGVDADGDVRPLTEAQQADWMKRASQWAMAVPDHLTDN